MQYLAVVLFGSNLADRKKSIENALDELEKQFGKAEAVSSVYETASWGIEDQPDYLNCVAGFRTANTPEEVLEILLKTELQAGRIREGHRYESRIIDLDLLLYDNRIINQEGLHVPHQRMTQRRFTMVPLAEIYPDLVHPESGKTMQDLLNECADNGEVRLLKS